MASDGSQPETVASLAESFADPPREYGPVPLWWWDGGELDHDRLTEQLESLDEGGVPAVCFISKYPNGPEGDDPQYFSEAWWDAMEHVTAECDRLDMELWVHDETYHHSPPTWREFWQDHLKTEATEREELRGSVLDRVAVEVEGDERAALDLPAEFTPLIAAAYPRADDGSLVLEDAVRLDADADDERVAWTPPEGEWLVTAIGHRPEGLCYTSRDAVDRYIDMHYEEYVRRLGDRVGDVLVGTFEDELVILDDEVPCDAAVLDRFRAEHGYDPVPHLVALFEDVGDATTRIRAEYYDVVTALLEECWFEPLYDWHEEQGLLRSHDNWGRNDIAAGAEQYGDYYRTMRWYQAPGYDDGGPAGIGDRNFFDAKLAASIAACYDRERVWGELFHSTTWGFRPESQLAGLVENVCYGCNLYDKHGLYYTTLGGWWAHAPPDVHFRQPYWEDVDALNEAATRLCYLFSQGDPVVDAALAFPSASLHADWHPEDGVGETGARVDEVTRALAAELYEAGTDLVIADDDTLAGAATDGELDITGDGVPALVLPPTTAIRRSTLETARELYETGGVVVAVERLPEAVIDGDDDVLRETLETLFGDAVPAGQAGEVSGTTVTEHESGGVAVLADAEADVAGLVTAHAEPDVVRDAPDVYHAHRRIGDADAYLVFNPRDEERDVSLRFRADGRPERWDPLAGDREPVRAYDRAADGYAEVDLTFAPHGFHLVVFDGGEDADPRVTAGAADVDLREVSARDGGVLASGYARRGGDHAATATAAGEEYRGEVEAAVQTVEASEGWTFEPVPTMDNEWGDFRHPPSDERLGVEVRSFEHRRERPGEDGVAQRWYRPDLPGDGWETTGWSYGPHFWRATDAEVGSPPPVPTASNRQGWEPYEFSTLFGKPGTHPYLLGYTSIVSGDVLVTPGEDDEDGDAGFAYFWTTLRADEAGTALCHYGPGVHEVRIGDREIASLDAGEDVGDLGHDPEDAGGDTVSVRLPAGRTDVLLGVEPGVQTFFAAERAPGRARDRDVAYTPRVRWFHEDAVAFDAYPWDPDPVGWYRFELPAGTDAFTVPVAGDPRVWVDGDEHAVDDGRVDLGDPVAEPSPAAVRVAQERGRYGGAAWTGPVSVSTSPVTVDAGDWRGLGLDSYSGRGRYRRTVRVPEFDDARVVLDLGQVVASASVRVNGEDVGTRFSRPFAFDVTDAVHPGDNEVEVTVANTLANHFDAETPKRYLDLATRFFGDDGALLTEADPDEQFRCGLLGPVTVRVEPGVEFRLR